DGVAYVRLAGPFARRRAVRCDGGPSPEATHLTHLHGNVERDLAAAHEEGDHLALLARADELLELLLARERPLVDADDDVARQDRVAGPRPLGDVDHHQAVFDAEH